MKHVYLNDKGEKIFDEIFNIQKKRIYNALLNSSSKEVVNFNNVLKKIIKQNSLTDFDDVNVMPTSNKTKKLI